MSSISGIRSILYAPLVSETQQSEWEDYAEQRLGPNEILWKSRQDPVKGVPRLVSQHLPIWQISSLVEYDILINQDILQFDDGRLEHVISDVIETRSAILSPILSTLDGASSIDGRKYSYLVQPVIERIDNGAVVGVLLAEIDWGTVKSKMIDTAGLQLDLHDGCGSSVHLTENESRQSSIDRGEFLTSIRFAEGFSYSGQPHQDVKGSTFVEYYHNTPFGHCEVSCLVCFCHRQTPCT